MYRLRRFLARYYVLTTFEPPLNSLKSLRIKIFLQITFCFYIFLMPSGHTLLFVLIYVLGFDWNLNKATR